MKKITLNKSFTFFIALFCAVNFGFGQTTLTEGDIAITGINATNPDEFSFVLLTDVLNGTTIHFTDSGWQATGGFRDYNPISGLLTGEGVVSWTAGSDLSCGTEIIILDLGANTYVATTGGVSESDSGFALTETGDQLIAYQGDLASPTFLFASHFGNNTGWTDATSTNTSAVPAGLTDGVNAVNLGNFANANYNGTTTSNQALILEASTNPANWTTSITRITTLGGYTYTCSAPGTCLSTVTWNGTWSGTPDLTTEVIIDANYNTNASIGSFKACSITVSAGATLAITNGKFIEVENDVVVNGNILVQTSGNFVQNSTGASFTLGASGDSRVVKQTPAKAEWYYYTYWSSPVSGQTIGNAFPFTDADRRFSFNAANYIDTNNDYVDEDGNDWEIAQASDIMTPGVGYAATEGRFHTPGATGIATFIGPFNTGDKSTTIAHNAANDATSGSWNLIGNPYPSAIDFIAFQAANSSVIDGVAYFWSQATDPDILNPGHQKYNFSQNDYAMFTVGSGGVDGASGVIPSQYIPSGQGFFVLGIDNNTVTFTNAMRMADETSNTQFFKSSNVKSKVNTIDNKVWVNLTSDNGVYNQILVAYVDGATNGNDGLSYDAPRILDSDFPATLYTTIENSNKKFAIQGKENNSLNINECIKLGFATNIDVPTIYKLSIAQLQGDFLTGNTVYLKDNLLNKVHNLSENDYTFTTEVGEFNERFEIVFNPENTLSTNTKALNENNISIVELNNDQVQFNVSDNLKIKSVAIFDLLGRQLYSFKGQSSTEIYTLSNISSTVYIAKITLSNGAVITKKAVKK